MICGIFTSRDTFFQFTSFTRLSTAVSVRLMGHNRQKILCRDDRDTHAEPAYLLTARHSTPCHVWWPQHRPFQVTLPGYENDHVMATSFGWSSTELEAMT